MQSDTVEGRIAVVKRLAGEIQQKISPVIESSGYSSI
jgi:hypothetical protein